MNTETQQNEVHTLFNDFLAAFNRGAREVSTLFTDDAAIEFPYAASLGSPTRLNKREYTEHLTNILPQMPGILFSETRIYPISETDSYWAETRGAATITDTGKKYEQDYVMYFTVRDGKFSFYREYWNPQVFLQASGGSANTK